VTHWRHGDKQRKASTWGKGQPPLIFPNPRNPLATATCQGEAEGEDGSLESEDGTPDILFDRINRINRILRV